MPQNIIRIHRPELTEEERSKRMAAIRDAAERLFIATEEAKLHKNEKE